MSNSNLEVVTGALGYTGRSIARRLLALGRRVVTLTGRSVHDSPFGGAVIVRPFNFDHPDALAESLAGADTLYNTYWVRFCHGRATFERAVANTQTLVRAAKRAGVRRIVHLSVSNPSLDSPWPYFRGKAQVEALIAASGLSYALLRPTLVFGAADILINNIAYLLRKLPVFVVPGAGDYHVQPVSVEDVAELAVTAGGQTANAILDAAGPDVFTFDELVRLIAEKIGCPARLVHVRPGLALLVARAIGVALGDVLLTREEIGGLMGDLLISEHPPTGTARLGTWLAENADRVGRRYASELQRHFRYGVGAG